MAVTCITNVRAKIQYGELSILTKATSESIEKSILDSDLSNIINNGISQMTTPNWTLLVGNITTIEVQHID